MANTVYRGPVEKCDIPLQIEKDMAVAGKPGLLVALDATGAEFELNALDGAAGRFLILKEKGQGESDGGIEADFAAGDFVSAYVGQAGHVFEARAASGVTLVADVTYLAFSTGGQLKVAATDGSETYVAVAKESKTTAAANELITVEVL